MDKRMKRAEQEMLGSLRAMAKDMRKQREYAVRSHFYASAATSDAYINGLNQAIEIVKLAMRRPDND